MARSYLRGMLLAGDRRSVGRVPEVLTLLAGSPRLVGQLVRLLSDAEPGVRMRAADALEKFSAIHPAMLRPYKRQLLALLGTAEQQELRWHLAQMVPRLPLTRPQRLRAFSALEHYLTDGSSIVRTFALQALADLALVDRSLRARLMPHLGAALQAGTPAMRARARRLFAQPSVPVKSLRTST